jgi:chemotaxis protein MotB
MFVKRKRDRFFDIWPAYVDILATVLMVLIFVLMTFVIAQLYLSDSIVNKDKLITELNKKVNILDCSLEDEKDRVLSINNLLKSLQNDVKSHIDDKQKLKDENLSLQEEIAKALHNIKSVNSLLEEEAEQNKKDKLTIGELRTLLDEIEKERSLLKEDNSDLLDKNKKYESLHRVHAYRSEFFSQLKKAIDDVENVKVVGDRFVLQSELLFDIGSTELGEEGQSTLKQISSLLKDLAKKIPPDINWILRVDGHTDKKPIRIAFPSNWELSSARAIAVVKFLIKEGIPEKRLVAAGFGEFQPLVEETDDNKDGAAAKNRRIEFKLDQQ